MLIESSYPLHEHLNPMEVDRVHSLKHSEGMKNTERNRRTHRGRYSACDRDFGTDNDTREQREGMRHTRELY